MNVFLPLRCVYKQLEKARKTTHLLLISQLSSTSSLLAREEKKEKPQRAREMEETKSRFKRICVFCGSSSGKKASYQEAAVELGKELVNPFKKSNPFFCLSVFSFPEN